MISQMAESLVFTDESQSTDEKNDFTYGFERYVKTFGSSVNIDDWIRTKLWIAEKKETDSEVVNR